MALNMTPKDIIVVCGFLSPWAIIIAVVLFFLNLISVQTVLVVVMVGATLMAHAALVVLHGW